MVIIVLGGIVGWVVGKFEPAFPLIIIATLFVLYDAWSALRIASGCTYHVPQEEARQGKVHVVQVPQVIPTLMSGLSSSSLATASRWVFVHIDVPVSYIAAGVLSNC